MWVWLLFAAGALVAPARSAGAGAARLVCYVESARATEAFSECTHLVYAGDARGDKLDTLLKDYKKNNPRLKVILRISEVDKDMRTLLKSKHVQGLEIYDAHKSLNKTKVSATVEAARSAITSSGGGPLFLALPSHPELLAKYYDLRTLVKKVDLMMVQTHNLGVVKKMTYHPSRLSGMWDMMNTDSVVDLVVGLGVPSSKVVISLPATAHQFTLANETLSTPGSPTLDDDPKEIDQAELCLYLKDGRWTLERDQDLSAPYAFKDKTWISFEDASSVDVKGKYARVRGLAGLALHGCEHDVTTSCGPTLRASLQKVLNQQSRAPRAAVLRSLEHEILSAPGAIRALNALQVSPYRITQVVDSDGVIHSIREDTRTEFSCSRQGYFVHPRSCARFYRCVKFDQLSPEYTVFEFDCPAGLAFDSRYEVCVWPGSLPHSQACPGSSEIAPVPKTRFICPEHEGYYADPENCRWFFACLDHGTSPLTAYEFRCPFGLGFDAQRLKCDWPWLVPNCGNIGRYEAEAHGFSGAILTGAAGFHGQTADAVNVAAHQSLVSGASLDNLVGIQGGYLTQGDALDTNFIASQELANAGQTLDIGHPANGEVAYHVGDAAVGLVQPTQYNNPAKYSSGSLILDDYRLPTDAELTAQTGGYTAGYNGYATGQGAGYNGYSGSTYSVHGKQSAQYQSSNYDDESGAYVHDPSGDYAEPYKHVDSPVAPYVHDDSAYKHSSDYYDYGRYSGSSQATSGGQYTDDNSGRYVHDNSGSYVETNSGSTGYQGGYTSGHTADYSGAYNHDDSGKYNAGVYRADGHIGEGKSTSSSNFQQYHGYSAANAGNYINDGKAYTGSSHTLTAGAINVGLVGKTTLVDANYYDQSNYHGSNGQHTQSYSHSTQTLHPAHVVSHVSQPAVSISHVGTDNHNLDGYSFVTTPTSSGIPTTATPFAVTTSLPVVTTYKTTFVPEAPKTSIKQVFGVSQPAVTYVQPTVIPIQHVTPQVHVTDHNQGVSYETKDYSAGNYNAGEAKVEIGYDYSKPSIKFEDGLSYTTAAPAITVSKFKPQGFSHNQETYHGSVGYQYTTPTPVYEEPFKKVVAYTTGPSVATYSQPTEATYTPQSFSHQTIHNVESSKTYEANPQVVYQQPTVVQYTTPQPTVAVQPAVSYQPQIVSHETVHQVDASRVNTHNGQSGYNYEKPSVQFEEGKSVYSTPAPIVTSTYEPQTYSHQTYHKVDTQHYVPVSTTPKYEVSYQSTPVTVYENPILKYTQNVTPVSYVEPTYKSQSFGHQTIHKLEDSKVYKPLFVDTANYQPSVQDTKVYSGQHVETGYEYSKPAAYQPQSVQYTTVQPAVVSTYEPQVYSHQTLHKVDASQVNAHSQVSGGYNYQQAAVKFEEAPKVAFEYSTPAPIVTTTYQPQVFSQQTLHNVDASQVHTYSQDGYDYKQPSVKYVEQPKTVYEYSTATPIVSSTYQPQTYSHQTVHHVDSHKYNPVSSTPAPAVDISYQTATTAYENPILKYTQNVTPVSYVQPTAAVYTQTYKPVIQQHEVKHIVSQPAQYEHVQQEGYSYSQPEIQRNVETSGAKTYSDASVVSHQYYHQNNVNHGYNTGKVTVSTSPANLIYEEHYSEYEAPKVEYKAPEYVPPRNDYKSYSTVSTASTPVAHQSSVVHQAQEYVAPQTYSVSTASTPIVQQSFIVGQSQGHDQGNYGYKSEGYSQQYETQNTGNVVQHSFSTSHVAQPQKVESIHFSYPSTTARTQYQQAEYHAPEIQVEYKAEEYLPPVVSTVAPVVSSTYKPRTYSTVSTTREYLPPIEPKNEYLPPSTTARPAVRVTTPAYRTESTTAYQAQEYLPPIESSGARVVSYESFGYNDASKVQYNPHDQITVTHDSVPVHKHNLVVETAKSHLLGFGTVGPDAGLVSESYTTAAPLVSSTYEPRVQSTTPSYRYKSTTEYQDLQDLEHSRHRVEQNSQQYNSYVVNNPYQEATVASTAAPLHRKQNIVVETAKSQLLGYGTTGPVSYTTAAPVSSSVSYSVNPQVVTSTYAPVEQGLYEVTPSTVPIRTTKPKVAVVTKINDFNPFLVRKLGAVCSCQSPVLVLKGRKPTQPPQDISQYNDYDDAGRGDISAGDYAQRYTKAQASSANYVATPAPAVASTFNPIIVPEDSYYQDLQDQSGYDVNVTPKHYETYVSSTPAAVSTTQRPARIRSRVKTVTVAPTYKTVLLNQEVAPTAAVNDGAATAIDSQAFDRYGPGGWRSRDETLQGSVDCQRAGLFRHPKECNKFYACRWDCTKNRFTLHVFNCPVQLSFDPSIGACNWPSQGPACQGDTLLTNVL
ncbi:uncharacterized protein LOC142975077 [Anticarsia gemmatalis]|uniref:uncharacterized protein LOC142975077 n=1 Tax=Anticarsia gemmatalis TaxID=129554 RepID=UPI003F76DD66